MTTTTLDQTVHRGAGPARVGATHAPIPFSRLVRVELRKMFDTRAGFWLLMAIGITSVLASAAAIAFAPDEVLSLGLFASAVGIPMSVILPMIAVLSVTSEYSQRTGLTTYTLVPHRGRTIAAKAVAAVGVGIVSMCVALGVGALGNLAGAALNGIDPVGGISVAGFAKIVLANVLGMMMGFTLGVLFRSSAVAIVGYFVYSAMLPAAFGMLAAFQEWFADVQPWVDFQFAVTRLYDVPMTGEYWAQLAVSGTAWLLLPLAVGLWLLRRAEVK